MQCKKKTSFNYKVIQPQPPESRNIELALYHESIESLGTQVMQNPQAIS